MTVYIEYVIIDNFTIDYMILKATFALTGRKTTRGRLFLCSLLGAAVALTYPALEFIPALSVAVKSLSGLLIVLIADNYSGLRSYMIHAALFFMLTFLTGGAIMGVFNVLGLEYSAEYSVALMFIPAYIFLKAATKAVRFIYGRRREMPCRREVQLTLNGNAVSGVGFVDTGNALYDGDRPVIVCGKKFAMRLIGLNAASLKIKKITVSTVSGKRSLTAFGLDELKIYNGDEPHIYNNVTACVTDKDVGFGYDVLLHPALEDENVFEVKTKIEKVS